MFCHGRDIFLVVVIIHLLSPHFAHLCGLGYFNDLRAERSSAGLLHSVLRPSSSFPER
jgi:hypothetical protein